MTQTSAHAASAALYSFFMLRGPGRYTSDRHAGVRKVAKRCAKKREWAAFLREQHNLLVSDNFSQALEEKERLDAEHERQWQAMVDQECDDYDDAHQAREANRRNQDFLRRLGEGALFWDYDYAATDTWHFIRVWFDDWDQHSDYWSTYCVATITIDRSALHWAINFGWGNGPQIELPYMEHSLEGVQQYTQLIYTLDKEDNR